MWTIGDVLDIVREGVPFSDQNTISVGGGNDGIILVSFQSMLPLGKARDLSLVSDSDLPSNLMQMFHPQLSNNGNYIYFGNTVGQQWSVINGFSHEGYVILNVNLCLNLALLAETARKIRDSNFYSVFEAALSDDKT